MSFKLCRQLDDLFPGSQQVQRVGLSVADDRAVWRYAGDNGFTLVSLDADLAELAALIGRHESRLAALRQSADARHRAPVAGNAEAIRALQHDTTACLEIS